MSLIPATILTGFLGAGKTTLLNHILGDAHGLRIAVIENEFGQENIDNDILVQNSDEQIVEMSNGCICCTIRGDLVQALSELARRRDGGDLQFDRVVIETTGLANPGPVAQTFFMDEEVASRYMLDAVITVVDARHAMDQLDQHEEAQRQVGFADRILLSKSDLADAGQIAALKARLTRMNPRAPIAQADFGRVALAQILDQKGFNLNDKLEIDPDFLAQESQHEHEHGHHDHECDANCAHEHHHAHHHAHRDDIAAFAFSSERPLDGARLDDFLGRVVQVYGPDMLRYKGILSIAGFDRKVVFQGVHQTMGTDFGAKWDENGKRVTKMVFIGRNLPKDTIIAGLTQCLV